MFHKERLQLTTLVYQEVGEPKPVPVVWDRDVATCDTCSFKIVFDIGGHFDFVQAGPPSLRKQQLPEGWEEIEGRQLCGNCSCVIHQATNEQIRKLRNASKS